jgi:hypothetical protein
VEQGKAARILLRILSHTVIKEREPGWQADILQDRALLEPRHPGDSKDCLGRF